MSSISLTIFLGRNVYLTAEHETPLHFACFRGEPEIARLLLDCGAQVNVKSHKGETPLHLVSRGDYDSLDDGVRVAELLLERGTDVNALDKSGWTPLHSASNFGKHEIARVLLSHGAKVNFNAENHSGETPLHIASRCSQNGVRVAQLLLDGGAGVNVQDKRHRSPLHAACYYGHFEIARVLLDHSARPEAEDDEGKKPLHQVSQGDFESKEAGCRIVELLLEHDVDVNARDKNWETPLHVASRCGRLEIVQVLLGYATGAGNSARSSTSMYPGLKGTYIFPFKDHCCLSPHSFLGHCTDVNALSKDNWTPLHYACCWGRLEIAHMLLDHGAKVILETKSGETPLHAVANGKYEHQEDGVRVAQLLLDCGVDVNARDKDQHTPLHIASTYGKLEIISLLLDNSAAVNAEDDEKETPLHKVLQGGHKPQDGAHIAQLLLEHGGDVNAQTKQWHTPLHVTSFFGQLEIALVLLEHGANVGTSDVLGNTPLHEASCGRSHETCRYYHYEEVEEEISVGLTQLLLEYGADVDAQNKAERTPLHIASFDGKLKISQLLLEHGANVNASDEGGETALHLISGVKHNSEDMNFAQLLLEHGADVNAQNKAQKTPLHIASFEGKLEISQLLLGHGANVNASDEGGETALHLISGIKHNSEDVNFARLLLEHGAEVNAQTKQRQRTPLHLAIEYRKPKVIRLLVDHGANVNAADSLGYTALHYVLRSRIPEGDIIALAQLLLEHRADGNIRSNYGHRPLDMLPESLRPSITQLFLKHGAIARQ
jgi:ankyrin